MVRLMHDSVDPRAIPRNAKMVAGYIDGTISKWPEEAWTWFPDAVMVRISAVGTERGVAEADVFDVEAGAIWPPERVVPLVVRARAAGRWPSVYVNQKNDWQRTRRAFQDQGVEEPPWWLAGYDGRSDYIPAGAVARQYAHPWDADGIADKPWETGQHFDLSVVADYWPGVDDKGDDGMTQAMAEFAEWYYKTYGDVEPKKDKTPGHLLFEMLNANLVATRAANGALADLVGKISDDPGITGEQVRQWMDESIGRHLRVSGTITIGSPAAAVASDDPPLPVEDGEDSPK